MSLFGNGLYDIITVLRDIATHLSSQTNALLGIAYNVSQDLYTVTGSMLFQKRIYIHTEIEFADNTLQSTAFTNELKMTYDNDITNLENTNVILTNAISNNFNNLEALNTEIHDSFVMTCTEVDSSIDNMLTRSSHVNTHSFFHPCIEFSANNAYRKYSIGLLGDNTTNGNQFCIAGVGGGGNDPNIVAAFDDGGNAYFANNLYLDQNLECNRITLDENLYVNGDIDLTTVGKKIIYPDNTEQTSAFTSDHKAVADEWSYTSGDNTLTTSANVHINGEVVVGNGMVLNSGSLTFEDTSIQSTAFTEAYKTVLENLSTWTLDTMDVWVMEDIMNINNQFAYTFNYYEAVEPNVIKDDSVEYYSGQLLNPPLNGGANNHLVANQDWSTILSPGTLTGGRILKEGVYCIHFSARLSGCDWIKKLQCHINVQDSVGGAQLPSSISGMIHDGNFSDWQAYGVECTRYIRVNPGSPSITFDVKAFYECLFGAEPGLHIKLTMTRFPLRHYR